MLSLYNISIASVIACAVLATSAVEGAFSPTPTASVPLQWSPSVMTTDYVRITAPGITIPIESAPLTCEVGQHAMLIQENDDFFITLCSNEYDGVFLAAFPINGREGRLAWTTPERKVIFAYRTSSCRGKMYFRQGDVLPVDAETRRDYKLRLERFNHVFPLYLSKKSRGIEFTKVPPIATGQNAAAKTARKKASTSMSRLSSVKRNIIAAESPSTNLSSTSTAAQKQSTTTPEKKEASVAKAESVWKSEPPATAGAATNKAAVATSLSTNSQTAEAKKTPQTGTPGLMSNFTKYQTLLIISVSLVLFIIGLYWKIRRMAPRREVAPDAAAATLAAGADGSGKPPPLPVSSNDFSGSIASMSLGSVTQFLNSDKETGTLLVKDKSNDEIGILVFIKGEIIDAKSPDKRGIDALYEILRNKEGVFSFLREEPKNVEKTITQGTISLLLDAHRIMDEEYLPPVPPSDPKATAKIKLHGSR